jgi:hypothetical protein
MADDSAMAYRREQYLIRRKGDAALKKFLEATPPNVGVKIENLFGQNHPEARNVTWSMRAIPIELFCETCDGVRHFESKTGYVFAETRAWAFVTYKCKNCEFQDKTFALLTTQDQKAPSNGEILKLGEFPPFGAPTSKRIAKLLGERDLDLYRKGMRAEAQGLGIGAATYFRRIVDNQWTQLVTEIREAAGKLGYTDLTAFDNALKETQFSKAVDMLKDAIPSKLLILDGQNPLTLLYQPLSVQLHTLTDEECLQEAADVRVVLSALLENIADVLKDRDELKSAAERLRSRKS